MNEIMLTKLVTTMNEKNARSNQPKTIKYINYPPSMLNIYKQGAMTWNSGVRL